MLRPKAIRQQLAQRRLPDTSFTVSWLLLALLRVVGGDEENGCLERAKLAEDLAADAAGGRGGGEVAG